MFDELKEERKYFKEFTDFKNLKKLKASNKNKTSLLVKTEAYLKPKHASTKSFFVNILNSLLVLQ